MNCQQSLHHDPLSHIQRLCDDANLNLVNILLDLVICLESELANVTEGDAGIPFKDLCKSS